MAPVDSWKFGGRPRPDQPSGEVPGDDLEPAAPADRRETEIASWVQAMASLVPAVVTLLVSMGIKLSGEQQLALTSLAGVLGTATMATWKVFRRRRG